MSSPQLCLICDDTLDSEPVVTVKQKGIRTFIENSRIRDDNKWIKLENLTEVTVHIRCSVKYSSRKAVKQGKPISQKRSRCPSSSSNSNDIPPFDFMKLCFICGKCWKSPPKRGCIVSSDYLKDNLLDQGRTRNDDLGSSVVRLIEPIESITAVGLRYHKCCYQNFQKLPKPRETKGRPVDENVNTAFDRVCEYIQNDEDCQFFVDDLLTIMGEHCVTRETLISKLEKKYGPDIITIRNIGKKPRVCFRDAGCSISKDIDINQASLGNDDKKRIIKQAAAIIRDDIRRKVFETESYPSPHEFLKTLTSDVPHTLDVFLNELIMKGKRSTGLRKKVDTIAQAILSATRPRSFISTLQLSVGTYLHRNSGSKFIIDILSNLGLCASYNDIIMFEASCIKHTENKILPRSFVQYVFDNANHNVCTIDGSNTFQSLGGICCITPVDGLDPGGRIQKCKTVPSAAEMASKSGIEIIPFTGQKSSGWKSIQFEDVSKLRLGGVQEFETEMAGHNIEVGSSTNIPPTFTSLLWGKSCGIKDIPSWKRYMERLSDGMDCEVSRILCLPFINLPPSHYDTLNTALHYAVNQAEKLKQKTIFVTFDLPLYMKAVDIVRSSQSSKLKKVVVRLGGFHLLMFYLGAVGRIMEGSGIEDLWATIYTRNSINKILDGHAFARAVRAHILTYIALGIIIIDEIKEESAADREHIENVFRSFHDNEEKSKLDKLMKDERLQEITGKLTLQIRELKRKGKTAELWLQYFECVTILLKFYDAERMGNWSLHLQSIREMLPFFHAAGHLNYAKGAQIYLQDMDKLAKHIDKSEFRKFTTEGYFTIRRSEKKWAGVWSDMTIKQTLMRLIHLGSGLTHGRSITPSVLSRYILGMPRAYEVLDGLEKYSKIRSGSSEQHPELRDSQMERDEMDLQKLIVWLRERKPFEERDEIMSLSTGIIGRSDVNCYRAMEVGCQLMNDMTQKNLVGLTLPRSKKVKTLATTKVGMEINGEHVPIDTALLFQRLIVAMHVQEAEKAEEDAQKKYTQEKNAQEDDADANDTQENVAENDSQEKNSLAFEALQFELSPYPLALFDENGLMRKSPKSELYKSLKPIFGGELFHKKFIIDGGFLLHRVAWPNSKTYGEVCSIYKNYICRHYMSDSIIVFDGYGEENLSIKSYERYRRSTERLGTAVGKVEEGDLIPMDQNKFLSNPANEKLFVDLLRKYLEANGVQTAQATENADSLIVATAINESVANPDRHVAIVGNDVDLLVLLTALTPDNTTVYFLKQTKANEPDVIYSSKDYQHLKNGILFAHAFTGCDTTSSLFSLGKQIILQMLEKEKSSELEDLIHIFNEPGIGQTLIKAMGEKVMLASYEEKTGIKITTEFSRTNTLNRYRFECFSDATHHHKVGVKLAQLPPTSAVAGLHSLRVYYQVQTWLGNPINAEDWGWEKTALFFLPIMNTEPPAPQILLDTISCSCKGSCEKACGCRKSGLKCTQFCKKCRGESCRNAFSVLDILDDEGDCQNSLDAEEEVFLNVPTNETLQSFFYDLSGGRVDDNDAQVQTEEGEYESIDHEDDSNLNVHERPKRQRRV